VNDKVYGTIQGLRNNFNSADEIGWQWEIISNISIIYSFDDFKIRRNYILLMISSGCDLMAHCDDFCNGCLKVGRRLCIDGRPGLAWIFHSSLLEQTIDGLQHPLCSNTIKFFSLLVILFLIWHFARIWS
jgi:hypothetical protein